MTKTPDRFTRTPLTGEAIDTILHVYVDARAELQHLEHYQPPRMRQQLERHATRPGCVAALAWHEGEPVGYAYGCPLGEENTWWPRAYPQPPADITREDGRRTFRIDEVAVLTSWRGTGTARKIHDHLLSGWTGRATLMVNPLAGDGKVQAVYEAWGYVSVAHAQPQSTAPVLSVMVRPAKQAAA
ncbi:GNAT family N-acetyltransferase [Streptomyces gamaensis]|uniref:GNAT family N-acetyltransferase n=1 Tax=Streptomyces gamaensis TaxID=1763542 RepID=A0ABW0Z1X0_9ACTN